MTTTINGAKGEGGGQVFRTALSLSMCLGEPVRIVNIRAKRKKPGLLRQHLTCLRAAQAVCNAKVSGDRIGSTSVTFVPGAIVAGEYDFAVGTAGSTTLVFQTVLPALLHAATESRLTIEGGTHNGMAPSYDFLAHCFLTAAGTMGCDISTRFDTYGFYPAGGGRWQASITPWTRRAPLQMINRGELLTRSAIVKSALLPAGIGERELLRIRKKLPGQWDSLRNLVVDSVGPGNIVSLRAEYEQVTAVFESVGEKSLSADRVAGRAAKALQDYEASAVAVGEHLADQLLLLMALGKGGEFTTTEPSQHTLTNISVIETLLGPCVSIEPNNAGQHLIRVKEFVS